MDWTNLLHAVVAESPATSSVASTTASLSTSETTELTVTSTATDATTSTSHIFVFTIIRVCDILST